MGRTDEYSFGINSFNRGMRCDADPDDIGGVYARLLKNVNVNKLGAVTTRFGNQMLGDPSFRGDYSLTYSNPSPPPSSLTATDTDVTGDAGWIQIISSATQSNGTIRWEMVHQGCVYYYDFSTEEWMPTTNGFSYSGPGGGGPAMYSYLYQFGFYQGTTGTLTDSLQVKATLTSNSSVANPIPDQPVGAFIYNLNNGERRRVLAHTWDGVDNIYTIDYPVDLTAWSGKSVIAMPDISAVEYKNEVVYAHSQWTTGSAVSELEGSLLAVANNSLFKAGLHLLPRHMIWTDPNRDVYYEFQGSAASNADSAGSQTLTLTTALFTRESVGQYVLNTTDNVVRRITGFISTTAVRVDGDTSTWDNDTIQMFSNWFEADSNITGIIGLDTSVAVFDNKNLYLVDIVNETTKIFRGKGTLSPKSLAVSPEGDLYWVSSSGVIYRLPQGGTPKKISQSISNANVPDNELGLIELIKPNYIPRIAGGIYNTNEYLVAVGDLSSTYFGYTIEDAVFVYNPVQDNWRIDTYPAGVFHTTIDNNNKTVTLFGSYNNRSIFSAYTRNDYQDHTGYLAVDDTFLSSSIESIVDLWQTTLNRPDENKQVRIFVRLSSDAEIVEGPPATGGTLVESIRDQETTYQSVALIPATSKYVTYELPMALPVESLGIRISSEDRIDISSIIFRCSTSELQNVRH